MTQADTLTEAAIVLSRDMGPYVFPAVGDGEWYVEVELVAGKYDTNDDGPIVPTAAFSDELIVRAAYHAGGGFRIRAREARALWTGGDACQFSFEMAGDLTLRLTVYPHVHPYTGEDPPRAERPLTRAELMVAYNEAGAFLNEDFDL